MPPPESGPDFPDGAVYNPPPSVYAVCDGWKYFEHDQCRDLLPFADWEDDKSNFIVNLVRPLVGEYHDDLVSCAQDDDCQGKWDAFFATNTALGPGGADEAVRQSLAQYPHILALYTAARWAGVPVSQIWGAYSHKYGD